MDTDLRLKNTFDMSEHGVTAVLGPTNTGKTYLAIERMLAHKSGVIGLPLRLLAREVYDRICARIGRDKVSLITGEEKIISHGAPYNVCTVEAMGHKTNAAFVAIDEVQLAGDFERGHVFTDRILHLRGRQETMLLGAATVQPILGRLLPGLNVQSRPRLSQLGYKGYKKISRLPPRSAIVAFSADEVYAIAEFIRRQRGGAAVVLGALSPRSRNAQLALYQSGEVDFLVATDAIGMGLNLDVDHVAFAGLRKFDGYQHRPLTPAELGQIAGRAGRFSRDGTFGVTGRMEPFDGEMIERLEGHDFAPLKVLQWRSTNFDFSSLNALKHSLEQPPLIDGLTRALPATDVRALERLAREEEIVRLCDSEAALRLLWDVCALPDYRKIAPAHHSDLIARLYRDLRLRSVVDEDYLAAQVALADNIQGDIDAISHRIAHIRSWTYVANRHDWLENPGYWQEKTRIVEDKLSDALHQCLTQRFVNRTTSILMKRLRENAMIEAEISTSGDVVIEGHVIGQLHGFRFTASDRRAENSGLAESNLDAKALRAAAQKALIPQYEVRSQRLGLCPNADLAVGSDGVVRWLGAAVASLTQGKEFLHPEVILLADEALTGAARERVVERLTRFISYHFENSLRPLFDLEALLKLSGDAATLSGSGRALAYQLLERQGCLQRREVADNVKTLTQKDRASLRECGVRFGTYHIFMPALLKPAPAQALTLLWVLANDAKDASGNGDIISACVGGRTSLVVEAGFKPQFYALAGYRIFGRRAVRFDSLEKLADLIRQALEWREGESGRPRPAAYYDARQFVVSNQMLSSLGVSHADMEEILKKLGYRFHNVTGAALAKTPAAAGKFELALPDAECVGSFWENLVPEQLPKSRTRFSGLKVAGQNTRDETLRRDAIIATDALEEHVEVAAAEPVGDMVAFLPQKEAAKREQGKIVQIWHYQPRREEGRRPKAHPAKSRSKNWEKKPDQVKSNQAKHPLKNVRANEQSKDNRQKNNRQKEGRAAKPVDPDSPFAKLAALRDKLKK